MILCSCTGLNTATLEEAINGGATRIKDVYDLAASKSGGSSRCNLPEQVIQCTSNVAQAWESHSEEDTPSSVLKIIARKGKAMNKENGKPCQNNCSGCSCSQIFLDEAQASIQGAQIEITPNTTQDKQSVKLDR